MGVRATCDGQGYISLPNRALLGSSLCKLLQISIRGIGWKMPCRATACVWSYRAPLAGLEHWAKMEWRALMKKFVFVASQRGLYTMDYEFNLMGKRCHDLHHFVKSLMIFFFSLLNLSWLVGYNIPLNLLQTSYPPSPQRGTYWS